jgi:hypothetical protein
MNDIIILSAFVVFAVVVVIHAWRLPTPSKMRPTIRFKRGTKEDVEKYEFIPLDGEPLWLTDVKELHVGDGITVGGIFVAKYDEEPKAFLMYVRG